MDEYTTAGLIIMTTFIFGWLLGMFTMWQRMRIKNV